MLRLLSTHSAPGAWQMACDEALLAVSAGITLRCYHFVPPCLSLGYFQNHAAVLASLPHDHGLDIVRRITGGGAIWHEHEVTYALVGVLGEDGLPTRSRDLYPLIHGGISQAVAALGGPQLGEQSEPVGDRRYRDEPRCFASPAAHDLLGTEQAGRGKVLGSAARARGRRVLLHGSLKLASNPWDREVTGTCGLDATTARQAIERGISTALGLDLAPDELSGEEQAKLVALQELRYGDTARWVSDRIGPKG